MEIIFKELFPVYNRYYVALISYNVREFKSRFLEYAVIFPGSLPVYLILQTLDYPDSSCPQE